MESEAIKPTKKRPVVTKEAAVFYNMVAMFVCACEMGDYLVNVPESAVHPAMKESIKALMGCNRRFLDKINRSISGSDYREWVKQWTERDYESYQAVFAYMSNMTDEQRAGVEEFAKQLSEGKVNIEYDGE